MNALLNGIGDRISAFCHQSQDFLTSWLGHRVEVAFAALLLLTGSFLLAWLIGRDVSLTYKQVSGRKLENFEAGKIAARIQKLRNNRSKFARGLLLRMFGIGIFAFVIPSIFLILGIQFYPWFFPNSEALLSGAGCGALVQAHLPITSTVVFVLSQFAMGFGHSLDVVATQQHSLSAAAALNPNDKIVGTTLIGYRYLVGGFVSVFFNYFWKTIVVFRAVTPEETRLVSMLGLH